MKSILSVLFLLAWPHFAYSQQSVIARDEFGRLARYNLGSRNKREVVEVNKNSRELPKPVEPIYLQPGESLVGYSRDGRPIISVSQIKNEKEHSDHPKPSFKKQLLQAAIISAVSGFAGSLFLRGVGGGHFPGDGDGH